MIYFLAGVVVGVFVPAPYDAIARTYISKGWNWLKGLASKAVE